MNETNEGLALVEGSAYLLWCSRLILLHNKKAAKDKED